MKEFIGTVRRMHSMGQDYISLHPDPFNEFVWEAADEFLDKYDKKRVKIVVSELS